MHTLELPCADQLMGNNGRGAVAFQAIFAAPAKQAQDRFSTGTGSDHRDELDGSHPG